MSEPVPHHYRFGEHTLEPAERRLLRAGVAIPLKPRAFDTLVYLVERAGHLVTKDELLAQVWKGSFVEESTLAKNVWLIRRALGEEDADPVIETVPRLGYRFVAKVESLASTPPSGGDGAVMPVAADGDRRARHRAVAPAVKIAALLAALALGALLAPRPGSRPHRETTHATPPPRPALAVLGFSNLTRRASADWLSTALAEMMGADLAAGERLRLVAADDALRVARAHPAPPGPLGAETLADAREQLAADLVLRGAYLITPAPGGESLRLDLVLQSTASGETLATISTTGDVSRLAALVDDAASRLRPRLGIASSTAVDTRAAAAAVMPARADAAALYAEGVEDLRRFDAVDARPRLAGAIALDDDFPLAHAALSRALAALGYDALAIAEAQRAATLSGHLERAQQLEIAAALAEARSDWSAAANTERSLWTFFPDNAEYGLALARSLTAGGRASDALAAIGALRRYPPGASADPRLDLAEADAQGALSDWPRQLASARRAAAVARERHLDHVLGEALLAAASAASNLGEESAARDARLEAARIFRSLGDATAEAGATISLANARGDAGDYDGAIAGYRQALATYERTGARRGAAHAWSDIANTAWMRGDVDGALAAAQHALELSREIRDQRGEVWGLAATGNVLADQGEIGRALNMQSQALAIAQAIGDRGYEAYCIASIADTHLAAGDLEAAASGYRDALDRSRALHDAGAVDRHQADLAQVMLAEGRLAEAAQLLAGALAGRVRAGDEDVAAQLRLDLAVVRNEQDRPREALALARQAASAFDAMHQSGNDALALAAGALAEAKLRDVPAAQADCDQARAVLRGNRQSEPDLFLRIAEARVAAAGGRLAQAHALAAEARTRAERVHALGPSFEARLVLGEAELQEGATTPAVAQLADLAREANARGFALVASRAAAAVQAALRRPPVAPLAAISRP